MLAIRSRMIRQFANCLELIVNTVKTPHPNIHCDVLDIMFSTDLYQKRQRALPATAFSHHSNRPGFATDPASQAMIEYRSVSPSIRSHCAVDPANALLRRIPQLLPVPSVCHHIRPNDHGFINFAQSRIPFS